MITTSRIKQMPFYFATRSMKPSFSSSQIETSIHIYHSYSVPFKNLKCFQNDNHFNHFYGVFQRMKFMRYFSTLNKFQKTKNGTTTNSSLREKQVCDNNFDETDMKMLLEAYKNDKKEVNTNTEPDDVDSTGDEVNQYFVESDHDRISAQIINQFSEFCNTGKTKNAIFIKKKLEDTNRFNIILFNMLLDSLLKNKRERFVIQLFHEDIIQNQKMKPTLQTYLLVIKAYCKMGKVDDGIKLMIDKRIMLNDSLRGDIMHGLFIGGKIDTVIQYYNRLCEEGRSSDYVDTIMIKGFCHMSRLDLALKFIKEKKTKLDIYKSMYLISAYIKEGKINEALELYYSVKSCGVNHDEGIRTLMVKGLCKLDNLDRCRDFMKEQRISYNTPILNSIIEHHCMKGDIEKAMEEIDNMFNVVEDFPNILTVDKILVANCNLKRYDEAINLLDNMGDRFGIYPTNISYGRVIVALLNDKKLDRAEDLCKNMIEKGLLPNHMITERMIDAYFKEKKPEEAFNFFLNMRSINSSVIGRRMYGVLLLGLLESRCWSTAADVMDQMIHVDKIQVTESVHASLVETIKRKTSGSGKHDKESVRASSLLKFLTLSEEAD